MKYICVHCHFYQPPRENPWLEEIELQDSAYPFHDWNERITSECYGPNAVARILDTQNRIVRIVNNYSTISFNVGPTLMSWLERHDPEVYSAILTADRESRKKFSGHGNAIAQAYHHMILPLANARDKETQVLWGIADFKARFGRDPEGMWLPETAVDVESLELLAKHGITYAILSPYQAGRIRKIGGLEWQDVSGGRVDPSRAYQAALPSGKTLALFFYDGPLSQAVAFERLLDNGERFANRLASGFTVDRLGPQLVHIATDGETYGHHHRHGDMALAYALDYIDRNKLAQVTNYGEFLEKHPPEYKVEIVERTSWSCSHGVGRWERNCGCSSGGHWGWNQEWRGPLRVALDGLRNKSAIAFEAIASELVKDPWAARDRYINVVMDRTPKARAEFIAEHSLDGSISEANQVLLWKLLELQRHAMMMYTSCGWFFDDLAGIETIQIIQYAGRVVQLYERLTGQEIEDEFIELLSKASSNVPEQGDGRAIYQRSVGAMRVDLPKLAAHYAISSLFESYPDKTDIYAYRCERESWMDLSSGRLRLVVGSATFTSKTTAERTRQVFGVLHFGDHNVTGGVAADPGAQKFAELQQSLSNSFNRADIPDLIRSIDKAFGGNTYTLQSMFRDEQRRVLREVLESTVEESESAFRRLYQQHAPLMRFLGTLKIPLPMVFQSTAGTALNGMLRRALSDTGGPIIDVERVKSILEEARSSGAVLDTTSHEHALRRRIEREADEFLKSPKSIYRIEALIASCSLQQFAPFQVYLSPAQTRAYQVMQGYYGKMMKRSEAGEAVATQWISRFDELAALLRLKLSTEA